MAWQEMLRWESGGIGPETLFICIGQLDCAKAGSRKCLGRGFRQAEKGPVGMEDVECRKGEKKYEKPSLQ